MQPNKNLKRKAEYQITTTIEEFDKKYLNFVRCYNNSEEKFQKFLDKWEKAAKSKSTSFV